MNNIENLKPFKRLCMTIGNLPTAYIESMSYYECITYLVNYLTKEVIPTVNNNSEVVKELQNYVEHYFDNLDVQEEINNKLDDMADSGELADIIAQYLGLAGVLAYDKVSDMVSAANLVDGSICKTLGYYSKNDNGGGLYKIRETINTDVTDGASLIAMDDVNLVAELIVSDYITLEQCGCIGDGTTDDISQFNIALGIANDKNLKISASGKVFYLDDDVTLDNNYLDLNNSTLKMNDHNITLSNQSILTNAIILNGNVILDGGRNKLSYCTIQEFDGSAITINNNGYEDYIEYIRIENNSNSTGTVCITNNSGDETISHVSGYGCYTGIITEGSDNYYEDIHLWLNNNNTFTDSIFAQINATSNVFSNCCSDSYNKVINLGASNLTVTLDNFNFINNNILFKNKSFVFTNGTTTGCKLEGNVICKLTNFSLPENNNTLDIGYGSDLKFNIIDGSVTETVGGLNYTAIQSLTTGANVTINDTSSIYLNEGKLNINLTMYISGTSTTSISIDLTNFLDYSRYTSRGFVPAIYNNYTVVGIVEYQLASGTLTFSIPSQETGTSFSAIGLNLVISK